MATMHNKKFLCRYRITQRTGILFLIRAILTAIHHFLKILSAIMDKQSKLIPVFYFQQFTSSSDKYICYMI